MEGQALGGGWRGSNQEVLEKPGDGAENSRMLGLIMTEPGHLSDWMTDDHFMREALRLAHKAARQDEVPIGAVIVHQGRIIARSWNQVETLKDATAHAEMLALTQAESALGDWRLADCDLYVTKEPCPMCAGAIVHCRIRRVIFGCPDVKGGAAGGFWNLLQAPNLNHRCEITSGILSDDCVRVLKDFFSAARQRKAQGLTHVKGIGASGNEPPTVFDGP